MSRNRENSSLLEVVEESVNEQHCDECGTDTAVGSCGVASSEDGGDVEDNECTHSMSSTISMLVHHKSW